MPFIVEGIRDHEHEEVDGLRGLESDKMWKLDRPLEPVKALKQILRRGGWLHRTILLERTCLTGTCVGRQGVCWAPLRTELNKRVWFERGCSIRILASGATDRPSAREVT